MSLFKLFTAALACTVPFASAYVQPKGDNPVGNEITKPNHGDILPVGKPFTITWNPTTPGTVTLLLLKGPATNLKLETVIVENYPNSNGKYDWTPSANLEGTTTDQGYGIQLIVETDPNKGQYQYTTQFGISNPNKPMGSGSSSSGSPSGATSGSGASSGSGSSSGSAPAPAPAPAAPAYVRSTGGDMAPQYQQTSPSDEPASTLTTASTSTATAATGDACAQKCNAAYDACRTAHDANMAQCAADYASCVGYNPFTGGSVTSATACSATAGPSGTVAAANGGAPAPYPTTTNAGGAASPAGTNAPGIGGNGTIPYMGGAGSLKTGAMGVALAAAGVAVLAC
ncbi:hypothetical protein TI39_contig381g00001 [Zymoseptoria brevis]|uniref:Yeast cell wall synthesis Kre9/Knh1-like N-terminal domain-containing protein n=1 Tax=Zymoseptoria brevis TaxID=1047168 RepID=A0A0F4GRY4_9PEZI|nr:hypothetical protein TI39_contig381g00001 [Zymoseptoria brevis]